MRGDEKRKPASKKMSCVQPSFYLAQKMGEELGRSEIL
jgi:hypothetical protein